MQDVLTRPLEENDPELAEVIRREEERQQNTLELIASENHVSVAVRSVTGSVFTNKYAEGYPGRRYYGGCPNMDAVEDLARERAKKLFNAEHANVQPHSGASANIAVYMASLNPGDTMLSLDLAHGGHLSHGLKVNISGHLYNIVPYGVSRKDERIDMAEVRRLARECKPKVILAGFSAYPRVLDFEAFSEIAKEVGARLMSDIAHIAGPIAVGLHPTPVPCSDFVTTTTHKTLRGPRGGMILCHAEDAKLVDKWVFPGTQGGPLMHEIAAKAVCFWQAMQPSFVEYQQAVLANARTLASELQAAGLRLVSGGTDSHLVLVDLSSLAVSGRDMERALEAAGIQVNRNSIPYDPRPPLITSGIRLGTPAITTRGFGAEEIRQLARLIVNVLSSPYDQRVVEDANAHVLELCQRFPIPTMS